MLVIVSDLHLTDGTSGETIKSGAFRVFRERLHDLAYDASWRAEDRYEPISSLDLLLLGDICDVIRSAKWCSAPPEIRPWGSVDDPRFAQLVAEITAGILEANADSLAVVRSLGDRRTITVPPAARDGRPARVSRDPTAPERLPVRVNVHYLLGNHDWVYCLPGPAFDAIRESLVGALGLCNSPSRPFPHDPSQCDAIRQCLSDHKVIARHGDVFEPLNFEGARPGSSLGDAIVIELLNRFSEEVVRQMGSQLPPPCISGLREIDNVRPLLDVPGWLSDLLGRLCTRDQADQVKAIWNRIADAFLALPFVRRHNTLECLGLRFGLRFSTGASIAGLTGISGLLQRMQLGREEDYSAHAVTDLRDNARFVVYGHTHGPEVVPLRAGEPPGPSRLYLNSGTWRAVHTRVRDASQEFGGYHVMTYLAFFKGDERKGRAYESWTGTLESSAP